MRKWIRQIHLYCGLIVSPYLLIYGLSSIIYNHRAEFTSLNELGTETIVERSFDIDAARSAAADYYTDLIPPYIRNPQPTWTQDRALSQAIRDELDMMGHPIGWEMHRESDTRLDFNMDRPGRKYSVEIDEAAGHATITGRRKSLWSVILSLHALYRLPNSSFVSTWGTYTEITTWVVFFFVVTGVYLWFARRTDRRTGLFSFVAGVALSAAIMFYAWMWS